MLKSRSAAAELFVPVTGDFLTAQSGYRWVEGKVEESAYDESSEPDEGPE